MTLTFVRETVTLAQPFDAVLSNLEPALPALNARLKRRGGPDPSAKIVLDGSPADVRLKLLPGGQAAKFRATFQADASSDAAARVRALLAAVRVAAAAPEAPAAVPEASQTTPDKE